MQRQAKLKTAPLGFRVFNSLNEIGDNGYLLRDQKNPKLYLHYIGKGDNEIGLYCFSEGTAGAGVWTKEIIEKLREQGKIQGLEAVKCLDIMSNDGSLN